MKLIRSLIILTLIFYSSCAPVISNVQIKIDKWCGSSIVKVAIKTIQNKEEQVTEASILVPISLKSYNTHKENINEQDPYINSKKLVEKTNEGLVLTLLKSNPSHIGLIYEKDEDSDNSIYIPYSFIANIDEETINYEKRLKLLFHKDFKNSKLNDQYYVYITFLKDEYGVEICDCMIEYFIMKLKFFWKLRVDIFLFIKAKLFESIGIYYSTTKSIKQLEENVVRDEQMHQRMLLEYEKRVDKCDTYEKNQKKLTSDLMKFGSEIDKIFIENCDKLKSELELLKAEYAIKESTINSEIENATINDYMDVYNSQIALNFKSGEEQLVRLKTNLPDDNKILLQELGVKSLEWQDLIKTEKVNSKHKNLFNDYLKILEAPIAKMETFYNDLEKMK